MNQKEHTTYTEIERKFLVLNDEYQLQAYQVMEIEQGYILRNPDKSVRIRIKGEQAFITIKGAGSSDGTTRFEWEKIISIEEARELMKLCEPGAIIKKRYYINYHDHIFEVDEFYGHHKGLVIAEVELHSPNESVDLPSWIGQEVTGDVRYYNSYLSEHTYCTGHR